MTPLRVPHELNETLSVEFLDKMWEASEEKDVMIDFSGLTFSRPFGTLIIAEGIKAFVRYRKDKSLRTNLNPCKEIDTDTDSPLSYLRFFKFFAYIDAPCGKADAQTHPERGYFPLTPINKTNLGTNLLSGRFQDSIEDLCRKISFCLVQQRNEYIENMITYCFREIIRNTFEHAEVDSCIIMAQNWWGKKEFEIALVDNGIGILGSIKKQHDVKKTEEAIDLSLEPGISGKQIIDDDDQWGNSGFGLYILSQLGQKYGSFSIYSSGVLVMISGKERTYKDISISGTGVKLRISFEDAADYFPNIRDQIVQEGEKIYREKFNLIKKASSKSRF